MFFNSLDEFLNPKDFHLDIYNNKIYIDNFSKIVHLSPEKIIINGPNKKITLIGTGFSLNKLADKELLIIGKLESLALKDE